MFEKPPDEKLAAASLMPWVLPTEVRLRCTIVSGVVEIQYDLADVQGAARGEGGHKRLAVASVVGLRTRNTTVTRGEED